MKHLVFFAIALLCTLPAHAAEKLKATYGLYTGGVRMIGVDAVFDTRPDTYGVSVSARTLGVFSKLLPWWGDFDTSGVNPGYQPARHDYTVSWMGRVDKATFTYDPPGTFREMVQTRNGETRTNPVGPDIAAGTRDLLSTMMVALRRQQDTGSCGGDVLTFDNARSFIVRFKDAGDGAMNNDRLSAYTGPARACTIEIIPQKGKWPKKPRGWLKIQEQAKAGGKLPTLWLASPGAGMPVIPVRVDIHTKYGDVIAHLTAVQ